jgi:hypothetical protein
MWMDVTARTLRYDKPKPTSNQAKIIDFAGLRSKAPQRLLQNPVEQEVEKALLI